MLNQHFVRKNLLFNQKLRLITSHYSEKYFKMYYFLRNFQYYPCFIKS